MKINTRSAWSCGVLTSDKFITRYQQQQLPAGGSMCSERHSYFVEGVSCTVVTYREAKNCREDSFWATEESNGQYAYLSLAGFQPTLRCRNWCLRHRGGSNAMQNGHPITYLSKALGWTIKGYLSMRKDFLAVMMAIDKWWAYLQRGPFLILTYHKSLCNLEDQHLDFRFTKKSYVQTCRSSV